MRRSGSHEHLRGVSVSSIEEASIGNAHDTHVVGIAVLKFELKLIVGTRITVAHCCLFTRSASTVDETVTRHAAQSVVSAWDEELRHWGRLGMSGRRSMILFEGFCAAHILYV